MNRCAWMFCALFMASPLVWAGPPASKSQPAFEQLKSLEGAWEGAGPEGTPVRISYKVVSEGSAVMEISTTIQRGTPWSPCTISTVTA